MNLPDSQPSFTFMHNSQEFFIWVWLDDDQNVYQLSLAKEQAGKFDNLVNESFPKPVSETELGLKNYFNEKFLPKVNRYLASILEPDLTFPEAGILFEKFNWIIENSLSYQNGQVKAL